MNKNLIMKTDILDIIFEKRNKAYGAYELRKFYPSRIKKAIGFMLIIAIAFASFTLLPDKQKELITKVFVTEEMRFREVIPEAEVPVKKPEAEKSVKSDQQPVAQKMFTSNPLIVPNSFKTDSIRTLQPDDPIGTMNVNLPTANPPLVQSLPLVKNTGTGEKVEPKPDRSLPMDLNTVDVPPSFPGGMEALRDFLKRNLQNPYDLENGATIQVQINFVVGYNGKLKSFVTALDGGEMYNKEVIRVLKKMPDWQPGKARGENVSVYYSIPVKFVMSD